MTKQSSFYILVIVSTLFSGCFGFDTNTDDNILGNYYVVATDDQKESLNYDTCKGGGGFSSVLVSAYVFEVLWNDRFILTKQHPLESAKILAQDKIRFKIWRDTVKTMRLSPNSNIYLDSSLNKGIDSIAKADFVKRLENGDLTLLKNKKQSDITFYYLIDIKNNPEEAIIFFNVDSLNLSLEKLKVGKFTNMRTY